MDIKSPEESICDALEKEHCRTPEGHMMILLSFLEHARATRYGSNWKKIIQSACWGVAFVIAKILKDQRIAADSQSSFFDASELCDMIIAPLVKLTIQLSTQWRGYETSEIDKVIEHYLSGDNGEARLMPLLITKGGISGTKADGNELLTKGILENVRKLLIALISLSVEMTKQKQKAEKSVE